jgi:hypothetical protein
MAPRAVAFFFFFFLYLWHVPFISGISFVFWVCSFSASVGLGFGFIWCFFGEGFWGFWWVLGGLLGWGVFGPGLGVRQGLHLFLGYWVSRWFYLGQVGVEAFVFCILCVY